jgi:hypothetical protein
MSILVHATAIHAILVSKYSGPNKKKGECKNYAEHFQALLMDKQRYTADHAFTLQNILDNKLSGGIYNIQLRVSNRAYHYIIAMRIRTDTVRIYHKWGCKEEPEIVDVGFNQFLKYIAAYNALIEYMTTNCSSINDNRFFEAVANNIVYNTIRESRVHIKLNTNGLVLTTSKAIRGMLVIIENFERKVYNHSYILSYKTPEKYSNEIHESDEGSYGAGSHAVEEHFHESANASSNAGSNAEWNSEWNDKTTEIAAFGGFLHACCSPKTVNVCLLTAPAPPAGGRRKTRNKQRNRNKRTRRNYRR